MADRPMKTARKSSSEREAQRLAEAFARAEAAFVRREDELREAEEQAAAVRGRDGVAFALEQMDAVEFERRADEADARVGEARGVRERAAAVVEAVRAPAAVAAEVLWREKVETAEVDERRVAEAIEAAEATLVKLRGQHALASTRVVVARREAIDGPASFLDPAKVAERAAQDEEHVHYYAPLPNRDSEVRPDLRERVLERRAELGHAAEDARAQLKQRSGHVDQAEVFPPGSLRPGESFPRVGGRL